MRISVVIPHFYTARASNLQTIVSDLHKGSLRPVEILVWNNEAVLSVPRLKGASYFHSPRNVGAAGRFLAALVAQGDWVFFLDNDTTVGQHTLENLARAAARCSEAIYTLEGRRRGMGDYKGWPKIYGHQCADSHVTVQLSLGRGELVYRRYLPRLLAHYPFNEDGGMDDIWFSACATRARFPIYVVGCVSTESSITDLSMHGVGACHEPGFYARRTQELTRAFQWHTEVEVEGVGIV